jgi:hypothetical protein
MTGLLDDNLTLPYEPDRARQLQHTHPGMASWADPNIGHCCRECRFWGREPYKRNGLGLVPRGCAKASALFGGKITPAVPHHAFACRFFEAGKDRPKP